MIATKITRQQRDRVSHRSQGKRRPFTKRSPEQRLFLELLIVLLCIALLAVIGLALQFCLYHGL